MKLKSLKYIFLVQFAFLSVSLDAQDSDFEIFRAAVVDLNTEHQKNKAQVKLDYETNRVKYNQHARTKPEVTILGMDPKKSEKLEKAIEEELDIALEDNSNNASNIPPPPPPPSKQRPKTPKTNSSSNKPDRNERVGNKPNVELISMFPNEPNEKLNVAKVEIKKAGEPIEWISSETITFTEEIEIEDIQNPKEREKYMTLSEFYVAEAKLIKTNFIEALERESKTEPGYQKMLGELKTGGFDLSKDFKKAKILEADEKVAFIKNAILKIVNNLKY